MYRKEAGLQYPLETFLRKFVCFGKDGRWNALAGTIYEMPLTVGNRKLTVFLQDGFFNAVENKVSHHSHSNTELHLMVRGRTEYMVEGKYLQLDRGQMAVIPRGAFHGGWNPEPDTLRLAFQISWPADELQVVRVPEGEANGLYGAIREYKETGKAARMGLYIALICSHLCRDADTPPSPVADRSFLINEFFCNNYAQDVSLEDLARVLNVSSRQASRLVQKFTGNTFQEELTACRIHAAKRLMQETDMSMERIAEAVGYKSYSGFWKVLKKE